MKTLSAIWPMVMLTTAPWRPSLAGRIVAKNQAYTLKKSTWKMELKATRPAQYSVSPLARSFQTMTMAMQRARPMRMRPSMYSGRSRRNSTARPNMSRGPMTQFCSRDRPSTFLLRKTRCSSSYFTLARGGYIMTMRPTARGTLVVPTLKALMARLKAGTP